MNDLVARRLDQRRRALDDGLDLIGWRFDPFDADAARVSIATLGAVVERYVADEDCVVATWWIRSPHVERRLAWAGPLTLRSREVADARVLTLADWSATRKEGKYAAAKGQESPLSGADEAEGRIWIELPPAAHPDARGYLRHTFTTLLQCSYRVVDFTAGGKQQVGRYLFARAST